MLSFLIAYLWTGIAVGAFCAARLYWLLRPGSQEAPDVRSALSHLGDEFGFPVGVPFVGIIAGAFWPLSLAVLIQKHFLGGLN